MDLTRLVALVFERRSRSVLLLLPPILCPSPISIDENGHLLRNLRSIKPRRKKQRRRNLVQPRIHPRRRLKNLSKIIKIEAYRTYYHSLRGYR